MMRGEVVDGRAHEGDTSFAVGGASAVEELVVDGVGDKGGGQAADILFEGRGDGVDVEVRVGDVKVRGGFEAFFDEEDLRVAAGFAVDALGIHSCCNGQRPK